MEAFNIENFISEYPDIKEENFIDTITQLQEFNELTLDPDTGNRPKPADVDGGNGLLKDQVFFKRFLAQQTPYKEILVFKGVGTGKTMTMAALKEANVFNVVDGSRMNPALVLVKGPGMKKNIEKELSIHFADKYGQGDRKRLESVMNKVAKNYEIVTWETFLKKTPNPKNYNDRIVIVDESHHFLDDHNELVDADDEASTDVGEGATSSLYNKLFTFLHAVKGCTKILLTGTPMRNSAADFADQMNLILPLDQQLPKGEEFMKKFFDSEKRFKKEMFPEFSKAIAGRVTYLRAPWVKKEVYGDYAQGFTKYLKLTLSEMSPEQTAVVRDIVENNKKAFGNAESRASVVSDSVTSKNYAKVSAKFKKLVEIIKDPARQGENLFIYSDHVNDTKSGKAAIFQLKQLFVSLGFTQISNSGVVLGANKVGFIDANDKNITESELERIIAKFNSPENKTGSFARIILGGPKLSEGYSFKNIRQIHILNPPWHMAALTQSVARGIRFGSLADFKNEAERHVTVFYHASYYHNSPNEECPDFRVYRLIEEKEYEIAQMIRAIKVNAVDCGINYNRNTNVNDVDYSQECNYEKCEYQCNTKPTSLTKTEKFKNFNVMYSNTTSRKIINELSQKFKYTFRLTFDELKEYFESHHDFKFLKGSPVDFILLKTLDEIISTRILFTNKYGMRCYVKEYNNVFFLSTEYSNDKCNEQFYNVAYIEHPIIRKREEQNKIIRALELEDDYKFISDSCKDKKSFVKLSFQTRILLIEQMFVKYIIQKSSNEIPEFICNYFKYIYVPEEFIKKHSNLFGSDEQKISHNDEIYHTLYYSEKLEYKTTAYKENKIKPIGKTRVFVVDSNEWMNTNDKYTFDFMKKKRKAVNSKNIKKLNIADEILSQYEKERAIDEEKKKEYYTLVEIKW